MNAAVLPFIALIIMWSIHLLDMVYGLELNRWGVGPRRLEGLRGILTMPFLHSHAEASSHLKGNSIPVFFLGWAVMYFYPRIAGKVVLTSWLLGGALVWLTAGAGSVHIGASGVVYGMAAFLFTSGLLRKQRTLMALSMLIVFLYGSMVWGILPIIPHMSWQGHLWGMVSGVAIAFIYKHIPPAVSDPKPIHFDEDEDDEEGMDQPPADDIHGLGASPLRVVYQTGPERVQDKEAKTPQLPPGFDQGSTSTTWTDGR